MSAPIPDLCLRVRGRSSPPVRGEPRFEAVEGAVRGIFTGAASTARSAMRLMPLEYCWGLAERAELKLGARFACASKKNCHEDARVRTRVARPPSWLGNEGQANPRNAGSRPKPRRGTSLDSNPQRSEARDTPPWGAKPRTLVTKQAAPSAPRELARMTLWGSKARWASQR